MSKPTGTLQNEYPAPPHYEPGQESASEAEIKSLKQAIGAHKEAFHAKGWDKGEDFDEDLWKSIK